MANGPNYTLRRSLEQQVIEAEVKNTQLNRHKSRAAAKTARTGLQEQEAAKESEKWNEYFKAVEQMNGNATYGGWTYAIMLSLEVMSKRPSLDLIGPMFSMLYDLLILYVVQPLYDAWVDDTPKSVKLPTLLVGLEKNAVGVTAHVERADGVDLKNEDIAVFKESLIDEFLREMGYTKQQDLLYYRNNQELKQRELDNLEKTQFPDFLTHKFGLTFIPRPKILNAPAQDPVAVDPQEYVDPDLQGGASGEKFVAVHADENNSVAVASVHNPFFRQPPASGGSAVLVPEPKPESNVPVIARDLPSNNTMPAP